MNIFQDSSNIQIRLLRDENGTNDDRIVIRYKGEDTYQIYFRDANTVSKNPPTHLTVLSGDELDVYIESLFTLLTHDKDPFEAIEFQIPCFPVLRYDIQDLGDEKLSSTLKTIMSVLYSAVKI
jgi:hypothetical protein